MVRDGANRPRRRLEVDARRGQLLELGLEVFSERPYDEVSIDDIAAAVGISKGLLYHYFPTKRRFYVACLKVAAEELLRRTEPDPSLPPLERLSRGLEAHLEYIEEHRTAYAAVFRGGIGSDKEVARIIERTRQRVIERLLEGLLAVHSPELRLALRGWLGFVEAASLEWASRSSGVPRAAIRDLIAQVLLRTLEVVGGRPPDAARSGEPPLRRRLRHSSR